MTPRDWQNIHAVLFWIVLGIALARARRAGTGQEIQSPQWLDVAVAILATLPFWFYSNIGLLSDDFVHASRPIDWTSLQQMFTSGGGDGFFRPIGGALLGIEAYFFRDQPFGWHAVSIGLHGLNVWLLCRIARLLGGWLGPMAGLWFGLHGARCEPVLWPAAQFDLAMTLFNLCGLWGLIAYDQRVNRWGWWVSLAAVVPAALSKEPGFLLLFFLAAWRVSRRDRIGDLWPHLSLAAASFLYRGWLLGGLGGYVFDQGPNFLKMAESVLWRIPAVLIAGWNLSAPFTAADYAGQVVLFLTLGLFALLRIQWPARSATIFLAACFFLSLLPVLRLTPAEATLEKSRLLYLPGIWAALLLSQLRFAPGRHLWIAAGALTVASGWALINNADLMAEVAVDAADSCGKVAADSQHEGVVQGLPRTIDGVYFFANGFPECVQLRSKGAGGPKRTWIWNAQTRTLERGGYN